MPFITTDRVKEIRNAIKKEFPKYKFSIRRDHYSSVYIIIKSGPLQLLTNPKRGNEQVNHFYVNEHYADTPDVRDVLQKVVDIARDGQHESHYDGDYGSIPNYYVHVEIGKWDKHYEVTK